MRKYRFTDSKIIGVLELGETGIAVPDLCREHGISSTTFYKWRSNFGGMDASMAFPTKALEEENRRPKKMYAEAQLSADPLKGALAKKWCGHLGDGRLPKPPSHRAAPRCGIPVTLLP